MSAVAADIDVRGSAALMTMPEASTPGQMLMYALQRDLPMEKLEKLMELQERWEANNARKAYVVAMAQFKRNPPRIVKDGNAKIEGRSNFSYNFATLGNTCELVIAGLAAVGISHEWKLDQYQGGGVKVTCVLTHEQGHSESTPLSGASDTSGSKNALQALGSTITYLQRYTLLSACGLAPVNDDDGQGGAPVREEHQRTQDTGGTPRQQAPQRQEPRKEPEQRSNGEPQGYQQWRKDADADVKSEGSGGLNKAWRTASEAIRAHCQKVDMEWWRGLRAAAERRKAEETAAAEQQKAEPPAQASKSPAPPSGYALFKQHMDLASYKGAQELQAVILAHDGAYQYANHHDNEWLDEVTDRAMTGTETPRETIQEAAAPAASPAAKAAPQAKQQENGFGF